MSIIRPGLGLAAALLVTLPAAAETTINGRLRLGVCHPDLLDEFDTARLEFVSCGREMNPAFDLYEVGADGFEDALDLLLHHEGEFEGTLRYDAALAMRVLVLPAHTTPRSIIHPLEDEGSFVRLRWRPEGWKDGDGLSLVGFPLDSRGMRLGFSRRLSWGHDPDARASVPGVLLRFRRGPAGAWAGATTSTAMHASPRERLASRTSHSALGGGHLDAGPFRFEVNGGWTSRWVNGKSEPARTYGGSLRAAYAFGPAPPHPVDLSLPIDHPLSPRNVVRRPPLASELSLVAEGELTVSAMRLEVGEDLRTIPAKAGDLQLRLSRGPLQLELTAAFRDAAFVLQNRTSSLTQPFVPVENPSPELLALASVAWRLEALRTTPGLTLAWRTPPGFRQNVSDGERQETVVIDEGAGLDRLLLHILPGDCPNGPLGTRAQCRVRPQLGLKAFARMDLLDFLVAQTELVVVRDPNRVQYADDAKGTFTRVSAAPWSLGVRVVAAAHF